MSDLNNNDTFTKYFKDMVKNVAESKEVDNLIKNVSNKDNNEPVELDDKTQEELLTVIKVINICEENSKNVNWAELITTFFISSIGLYMTYTAMTSKEYLAGMMLGSVAIGTIILAIMNSIKDKKRALEDAIDVKLAAGLDDNTLTSILKYLAKEGNEYAQNYCNKHIEKDKGMTL